MRRWSPFLLVGLAGCSGAGDPREWAGTIDTLAGGTVVVENPADPLWEAGETWTVREELRIGSPMSEGPDLFGSVTGLAVDPTGQIHVLDRQAKELRTFGRDGRHVRTVGGEGAGPGEFRDPIGLALDPAGDRLLVVDPTNARYAVITTSGEFLDQYPRRVGGYSLPWNGGFDAQGLFNEKIFTGGAHAVLRMDSAFVPADTAMFPTFEGNVLTLTTESGRMSAGVPFAPDQLELWDPRGYLWTANTGDYLLTQMTFAGDTVRIIRGPPTDVLPVSAEDRDEALAGLEWFRRQGGRVDPGIIPGHKPPITTFHIAKSGHIWVRLTDRTGETGARYHVLDPDGRFLGVVSAPESFGSAPLFRDAAIYGVVSDSLGVQYIVRNGLTQPAG